MRDWLPIETAPKDGSDILVFSHPRWYVACWSENFQAWSEIDGNYSVDPTHWQPLPDAPTLPEDLQINQP